MHPESQEDSRCHFRHPRWNRAHTVHTCSNRKHRSPNMDCNVRILLPLQSLDVLGGSEKRLNHNMLSLLLRSDVISTNAGAAVAAATRARTRRPRLGLMLEEAQFDRGQALAVPLLLALALTL